MKVIDGPTLAAKLTYPIAIDALERAFDTLDPGREPLRTSMETSSGTLLLMPATSSEASGVKLVTITPENRNIGLPTIQATYVLIDGRSQAILAVLDGAALTAIRTSAVSALATTYLAKPDARALVVFGAGVQATAHVEAIRSVRAIAEVVVVSRSSAPAERLVADLMLDNVDARVGVPSDVAMADIVCTCTTSQDPVFDGSWIAEGAHVNAVGTYTTDAHELDIAAVRTAGIVVETREAAAAEAGDLVMAFGDQTAQRIDMTLQDLVRGRRLEGHHHTVFKSVGLAFEDLAVATSLFTADPAG